MSSVIKANVGGEIYEIIVGPDTFGEQAEEEDDWSWVECYTTPFLHALGKIAEEPYRIAEMRAVLNEEQKEILRKIAE